MGKGSLYYHVESKENLLFLIHERVMREVSLTAKEIASSTAPAREHLDQLAREQLRIITAYPDHVWVFMHEFRYLDGERHDKFVAVRREYEASVRKILEDGIAAGEFHIADVELTTLAWLGMYNYTYVWLRENGRLKEEEIADQFQAIFLSGILAVDGPKGSPAEEPRVTARKSSASSPANRERVTRKHRPTPTR